MPVSDRVAKLKQVLKRQRLNEEKIRVGVILVRCLSTSIVPMENRVTRSRGAGE